LLSGVLRNYLALEKERFDASLARDAVKRLQFGWIALDRTLKIIGADPFAEQLFKRGAGLSRDQLGRLAVKSKEHAREIQQAVAKLSDDTNSRPVAVQLRSDPWLDMLLVPSGQRILSGASAASVIAYVHGDNWRETDRHGQMADLFSLTPKEAKLALALCRGSTIAEAAPDVGLTVGSARIYSKSIFAKTGARGQPDLVRIVMGSILALSPE
jgi:DNA-binding CsgD family transcriptional regulator